MKYTEIYPLTEDVKDEILKLSALNYSIADMALYFDFDPFLFKQQADNAQSEVAYNIRRGKLILKANADVKLFESAENGNITAFQQLVKILKERKFNDLLNSIGDD